MSSILTNNSSMVALETLRNINKNLSMVQNEISTGKKVNSAKDNAAVWAISTVMSTDVESFKQITDSLNVGSATVGVARTAAEAITAQLQDMKELIVSAQQDLNDSDRATIQTQIDNIRSTISGIVSAAQLNGVNLLQGTDAMNVLASLDRASDGTVSTTNISVSRNDLGTSDAVDGAAKEDGDAGYVSTEDTIDATDVDKEAGDAGFLAASATGDLVDDDVVTLTFTAGAIAAGDVFSFTLGGEEFSYTAEEGDTLADVADALRADLDDAGLNLDATGGTNGADPEADDTTIVITANGAVTWDQTTIAATYSSSDLQDGSDVDVTIAGGDIAAGETFTINVGGTDYTYTAEDGDTVNDVAAGLETLLNDAGIDNLVVDVTDAEDPAEDAATINLAADGGTVAIDLSALASAEAGTAAGGLVALGDIDVTSASAAEDALTSIETLLSTAISAASDFGSTQTQIEAQGAFVLSLIDSMTSGIGAMVDADMEAASAKLQAIQVQQQLGVQALAIANSSPQALLALFR